MAFYKTHPYDIDINKMMVFTQHQKDRGLEYNSLKLCIAALSFYFRTNNLPNLTLDVEFVNFHKGILRDMRDHRDPNRKEPWEPHFFDLYISKFPLSHLLLDQWHLNIPSTGRSLSDDVDYSISEQLEFNPYISARKIAKKPHCSISTVLNRCLED